MLDLGIDNSQIYEIYKNRLLDMSGRNKLISFKLTTKGIDLYDFIDFNVLDILTSAAASGLAGAAGGNGVHYVGKSLKDIVKYSVLKSKPANRLGSLAKSIVKSFIIDLDCRWFSLYMEEIRWKSQYF